MRSNIGIWPIFVRECRRIAYSKICLWGIFSAAILSLIVMVYMMNAGLPTKIPIAVVDLDNTATTRNLIRQLDAFPKTDIKFKSLSFNEARHQMERMEVFAILTIPHDFTKDALSGNQPKLVYYTNNAFLISGSLLFQDLKTISTLASASVGLQTGQAKGYTDLQLAPILQPITTQPYPIANPWLNYSLYLNNAILPGVLQLIIFIFTASCLGSEIKSGSGRYLMRLGGESIWKVLIGKLLPYTIVYIAIALLFMSVFYHYCRFPLHSGFFPMFLDYLCLILASQGLGLVFIGVFRNYRMALSSASLMGMLSFSIAGFSFSTYMMDPVLQALSQIFPLRHFFLVYVDQALNGISMKYSAVHYGVMVGMAALPLLVAGKIKEMLLHDKYEP